MWANNLALKQALHSISNRTNRKRARNSQEDKFVFFSPCRCMIGDSPRTRCTHSISSGVKISSLNVDGEPLHQWIYRFIQRPGVTTRWRCNEKRKSNAHIVVYNIFVSFFGRTSVTNSSLLYPATSYHFIDLTDIFHFHSNNQMNNKVTQVLR